MQRLLNKDKVSSGRSRDIRNSAYLFPEARTTQRRAQFMTPLMQPHAYGSNAVVMANSNLSPPPSSWAANQHISDDQPLRWLPEGSGPQQNMRQSQRGSARLHSDPRQTSCARWLCSWNLLGMTAQETIMQAASGITSKQGFMQHISHFLQ